MRVRRSILFVAGVLVFAGCGDDGGSSAPVATTSSPAPVESTIAEPSTSTTTAGPTTTTPTTTGAPAVEPGEARVTTIAIDDPEHGELVFDARVAGPVEGEAVFLLHGFPSTSDQWRHQLPALGEAGYRVIAPDQRGYSPGARPPEVADYTLDKIAGDVLAMADVLGIESFHVVGHDFGGAVTWTLAGLHPRRLLSATSISTPHPTALLDTIASPDSDQAARSSYVQTFVREGSEVIFVANDAATLRALYAGQGLSAEEMQPQLDVLGDVDAMRAALNWYRASFNESGLAVGDIDVPTMFIWSTGDEFLGPDPARLTADHVTGGYRFEIIDGVDHWVPEKAASLVNSLLLEFLADPGAVAPGERVEREHPAP